MTKNFWRKLVENSLKTEEDELDCSGCMDLLDQYVDLLEEGQTPGEVLPQLEQHLAVCHCCEVELKGILVALKAAATDND